MKRSVVLALALGVLAAICLLTGGCRQSGAAGSPEAARARTRQQPQSAAARVALGRACLDAKLYNDAFIAYREAANLDQKNFEALHGLGEASLLLGDAQGALTWAARALALKPDDAGALGLRGRARLATNQVEQALPELERAANLDPSLIDVRLALLSAYHAAHQDDQALAQAAKLTVQFPSDPRVRFAYGALLEKRELPAEAEKQYREALRLDPNHRVARFALALVLVHQHRQFSEARRLAAEVDASGPDNGTAAGLGAWALFLSGKQEEGLRELALVYKRHPENMQLVVWIREAALKAGQTELAEAAGKTLQAAGVRTPPP